MRDEDRPLLQALGDAVRGGGMRMHVHYRRARRDRRFRDGLVRLVGARTVLIRDVFAPVSLGVLLVWFLVAESLKWHETQVYLAGQPMTLGTLIFLGLLLTMVVVARTEVRKAQGKPLAEVVTSDPALFEDLWRAGALAIMSTGDKPQICQSPRGDWRQFVRHHAVQY
ncbi:MAG: hypothetical protein VYB54_15015 [Pseudomonadota bacterium]|nr:hypothetical protein [Pseudomonadota bacterium]